MSNTEYRWLTEMSQQFLNRDYLLPGQTLDERVNIICNEAERRLGISGFAKQFKKNIARGWYSLSTPIWANFGTDRGLPISCFGSMIEDNMESILFAHAEVGMMSKYGGGTSVFLGNLRPRGSDIKDNGQSSGAVHFGQLFDSVINIVSQGKCYVEGTQVLTNRGFLDFRKVVPGVDLVADVDEHNHVSFTSDYKLVVEKYDGELVCLSGKKKEDSVSLKVTPNHRMVVNRRKMKDGKQYWSDHTDIVLAKDLKLHRDNRLPLAAWSGEGVGLSDEERLRIAYQADGAKDGENRKIRFHFSKERKIARLKNQLNNLGIPFTVYDNPGGTTDISFDYVSDTKIPTFSEWVRLDRVSGTWAEQFIEELSHWDATVAHGGAVVYSSTIESNVNIVQAVAALANMKTRLWNREAEGNRSKLFSICISRGAYRDGEAVKITNEKYTGKVYCAVVPNGRLIVRYENRVMVCGNTRRGNCALYLPIEHPDILEFLTIRTEGSPMQDISFGVTVTDEFMRGMIDGDPDKRKIWARVIEARVNTGYPYIMWVDTANKNAPLVYQGKYPNGTVQRSRWDALDATPPLRHRISHSNLCSEIMLPDTEDESFVCDLSSMNILHYDEWKDTDAVQLLVFFLDAVMSEFIEKARKIPFLQRAVNFAERHRALGVGWLGWHSYLQSKMIPFESMAAKYHNINVAKSIHFQANIATEKLAIMFGEPLYLKGHGRRNTTLMAIAPTKSSAFILGQVSEGIEPHRANYYIKDLAKGKFTVKNPHLEQLLESKGNNTPEVWDSILKNAGSVQHLDILTDDEKAVFKTFQEISPKEIIIQAGARQRYIDQGQSLNLMIPPSVPTKEVNQLLILAWELGVKALYYQISVNAAQELSRSIMECVSCSS